ncbi:MAG: sulfite oxidase [Dehalococcoidia bacterium]|nr:sulfite oxidase [Dehalococcoidia bacterium]
MSMFVVQHQHPAEGCPAGHPQMAPMLLKHLSAANAAKFGVKIKGEAVLDGRHTLYLFLEAENADKVREYMSPFAQAGSVEVWPSSPCEKVVARGKC